MNTSNKRNELIYYSANNSTSEYMKIKIEALIDEHGYNLNLEEISNKQTILEKGIGSLPALEFNDQIIEIGEKDIVTFQREVLQRLTTKVSVKPTIIVPTDFSEASKKATSFAVDLAAKMGSELIVLHVDRVEYADNIYPNYDKIINSIKNDFLRDEVHKAKKELKRLDSKGESTVKSMYRTGFAAEQILSVSDEVPNAMIIMGTTGKSSALKKFIGSVSTSVGTKSKVPVFLIPPDTSKVEISHLLYCAKEAALDTTVIEQLLVIAKATKAKLHIMNMSKNSNYDEIGYMTILREKYPKAEIKYTELNQKADTSSVIEFAESNDIDAIVVSTKNRTKIEKLFHHSFSFDLAVETKLPLLILHN